MNNYWDCEKDESEGEKARDGDDDDVGGFVLGSDCPEEDIAQGAVMGELPVAGEAAHQQAVGPRRQQKKAKHRPLAVTLSSTLVVISRNQLWHFMCFGSLPNIFSGSSTSIMIV